MNEIMVSVCCLSYNHEDYIRQCLDGIVMQRTSFRFEVLVHDDASTDKSQQIIFEYATTYPEIIKPIFQKENQYSKGKGILAPFLFPKCRGKYVAFCECDDYWTDPQKLQRQVDFLESNPDYVTIAENGLVHNTVINKDYPFNTTLSHDISLEEVIITPRFPTAGVVCRRDALDSYFENCRTHVDIIQWCWLISKGKCRYENTISSVYRKGQQGVTIFIEPFTFLKKIESWNLEILRVFDVKEDFIYSNIFKACLNSVKLSLRRLMLWAAIKCFLYSCKYAFKALNAKLRSSYK